MQLKGGWWGADFLFFPLYNEISRRSHVPLKELYSFYRISEVIQSLEKHRPSINKHEIKNRQTAYVLWLKNQKLSFISGQTAKKIINKELKQVYVKQNNQELKGKVASSGFVTGRVRILVAGNLKMLNEAMKTVKKGDIMMISMTQPNMVPLMKKVAAIVTDEGGMISHAAIMAREFGIPCLVGTEIATKVFKDGDMVEVDANKGIVRKLD